MWRRLKTNKKFEPALSSIHTLLKIGHRFFVALLREGELRVNKSEWAKALVCLEQYRRHIAKLREAAAELLHPKLLEFNPELESETAQLIHDYDQIDEWSRLATRQIYSKDRECALALLSQLREITDSHWLAQIQTLYAAADVLDEQLLAQVAEKLAEAENMPTQNSASLAH